MTIKELSQQLGTRLPEADDLLRYIGLQQQRTANDAAFGMIGAFALGTVVGGALALLFAPKPGHQLRQDLGERLDDATQRIKDQSQRIKDQLTPTTSSSPSSSSPTSSSPEVHHHA
jgi:YtxH-like protein